MAENTNAQSSYAESKKLLDDLIGLREQQRATGGAIHPGLERAITDQMGVVGRKQYWLDNPGPSPRQAYPEPASAPPQIPAPSPPIPSQAQQPARLEWNGPQNPRAQFVMPPSKPLGSSPPQAIMTSPPQTVMAGQPQEIQARAPQTLQASQAPQAQRSSELPPAQPQPGNDPWAEFRAAPAKTSTQDPWAEFRAKPMAWGDVPGQALRNAPASAGNLLNNLVQPILHPINTVTDIADMAAGGLRAGAKKVLPESVFNAIDATASPETTQRISGKAGAVGDFLMERYGTEEGLKKALATDPVGVAADISMVLTGGGSVAARVPGAVGHAGEAVATAGRAVDPIANAGSIAMHSGGAVADFLGTTTGAGGRPIREAFKAGQAGNQAFTDNMRGNVPLTDVVEMAKSAQQSMKSANSSNYRTNMEKLGLEDKAISFDAVQDAINKSSGIVYHKGIVKNEAGAKALGEIQDKVSEFAQIASPTAADLDALKQAIHNIHQSQPFGSPARAATGPVFDAARSTLIEQSPKYAEAMGEYGAGARQNKELGQTFSLNGKASDDTILRKLQSVMRDGVNTNYGARANAMENSLVPHAPDLMPSIAGQSLSTTAPRGLARLGVTNALAGGAAMMNPATLGMLPLQSPRLIGEMAYGAGSASGGLERALAMAGISLPDLIAQWPTMNALSLPSRSDQRSNALAR